MKKTIKIIALVVAAVMLISMMPVVTFAADESTLAELGQDTYYTGDEFAPTEIVIDGVVDEAEGWVAVTPEGADMDWVVGGDTWYRADTLSNKEIALDDTYAKEDYKPSTKYYVAQDDEYVYFAVDQFTNKNLYKANRLPARNSYTTFLHLGFNAEDYTQQVHFYSKGQYKTTGSASGAFPAWCPYPFELKGMSDNETGVAKTNADFGLVDYDDSKMKITQDDVANTENRVYEFKLSKAAIAEQYEAVFGAEVDFSAIYIGMTIADYGWENNADVFNIGWANGTVLAPEVAEANGVNAFIPDVIKFRSAPVPPASLETLEEVGLTKYYAGAEFAPAEIVFDGVINDSEGWVAVTPDGAKLNWVDGEDTWFDGPSNMEFVAKDYEHTDEYSHSTKYYVAQDDEFVYFAVDQFTNYNFYKANRLPTRNTFTTFLRLGFNPENYTQQVVLYSTGQYKTTGSESGAFPAWCDYAFEIRGIADNETYTRKTNADFALADYADSRMEHHADSEANTESRIYEFKLSKAAIKEQYAAAFGADAAAAIDFGSMFVGLSLADYAWENNADVYGIGWANGTVVDAETAAEKGVNTFVPDLVVFEAAPVEDTEEPTTEEPTTEEPTTEEPTTEEPATDTDAPAADTDAPAADTDAPAADTDAPAADTDAPATDAPAADEKGCGGSVTVAGLALVAALGTCTVFVAKKKED